MIGSFEVALTTLRGSAEMIHTIAMGLIASFALLALIFASMRALVVANSSAIGEWVLRLGLVLLMMALYFELVEAAVDASNELSDYFGRHSDVASAWSAVGSQLVDAATDERRGVIDRLKGIFKTMGLAHAIVVSQMLIAIAFLLIRQLSAVVLAVMYCLGPLVIAAGVFDGNAIKVWLISLVHVLLWPVVPPLALMLVTNAGLADSAIDNVSLVIAQNICLAGIAFASPFIVGFLFGKSGAGSAAAVVTGLAATALTKVVTRPATAVATSIARQRGTAAQMAGTAAANAGAGVVAAAAPGGAQSVGGNRPEAAVRHAPPPRDRSAPPSSQRPESPSPDRPVERFEGIRAITIPVRHHF